MKKTLLTIFQLLVTGALLYWVFHNPAVRTAMAAAIRDADYRWIGGAILAYLVVEVAAMVRMLCGPDARYITGQAIHVNGGGYMP